MAVNIYLNFDGNCKEAVHFYAKAFGLEPQQIMTFGEGPSDPNHPMPEAAKDRVMHTFLPIGGGMVMFSDTFPGMPFIQGNNMSMTVTSKNIEDIQQWFGNMKEGATIQMDLQETFWSKCYGSLVDKFGICWQFSHESEQM